MWKLAVLLLVTAASAADIVPGQFNKLYGRILDGGPPPGCTFSSARYEHGERVPTPEACLNCTCTRGVLVCYLRVCPTVAPPGPGCFAAREPGQCCPTVLCSKQGLYDGNTTHSHHIHDSTTDEPATEASTHPIYTETTTSTDGVTTHPPITTIKFSTTYFPMFFSKTSTNSIGTESHATGITESHTTGITESHTTGITESHGTGITESHTTGITESHTTGITESTIVSTTNEESSTTRAQQTEASTLITAKGTTTKIPVNSTTEGPATELVDTTTENIVDFATGNDEINATEITADWTTERTTTPKLATAITTLASSTTTTTEDDLEFRYVPNVLDGDDTRQDNPDSLMLVTSSSVDLDSPDLLNSLSGGCLVNGTLFAEGSALLSADHCEYCYCVKGKEMCLRPRCTLYISGCRPRYVNQYNCCPSSYACEFDNELTTEGTTTTVVSATRPSPPIKGCSIDGRWYKPGDPVPSTQECHTCYCAAMGKVRCTAIECSPALEGCRPVIPEGLCCPLEYDCNFTKPRDPPTPWNFDADVDRASHSLSSTPHPLNFLDFNFFKIQPKMADELETTTSDSSTRDGHSTIPSTTLAGTENIQEEVTSTLSDGTSTQVIESSTRDETSDQDQTTVKSHSIPGNFPVYQSREAIDDDKSEITSTQEPSTSSTQPTTEPGKIITPDISHLYYLGPHNDTETTPHPKKQEDEESYIYVTEDQLEQLGTLLNQSDFTHENLALYLLSNINNTNPAILKAFEDFYSGYQEKMLNGTNKSVKATRLNDDDATPALNPQMRFIPFNIHDALIGPGLPMRARNRTAMRPSHPGGKVTISEHCYLDGRMVLNGDPILKRDPCLLCRCFYGKEMCSRRPCGPPPSPDCIPEPVRGYCCPKYLCAGTRNRRPFRPPSPQEPVYKRPPPPDKMVVLAQPKPQEKPVIYDILRPPTTIPPTVQSTVEETRPQTSTESRPSTTTTTEEPRKTETLPPIPLTSARPESNEALPQEPTLLPFDLNDISTEDPQLSVPDNEATQDDNDHFNLFKVSGCDIYGEYYPVNSRIDILTKPCKECRCTVYGVQCQDICL